MKVFLHQHGTFTRPSGGNTHAYDFRYQAIERNTYETPPAAAYVQLMAMSPPLPAKCSFAPSR